LHRRFPKTCQGKRYPITATPLWIPDGRGLRQEFKGNNPAGCHASRYLVKSPDGHGDFTRLGEESHCLQQGVLCNLLIIKYNQTMPHPGMLIAAFFSEYLNINL
jgi:hypothetical protein